ncbi:GNAT family N-acetyltransferase [Streptomyces sp. PTM05]|uniref:GNAT family N-acetyltransferase n=1 Tax=Streptantibioticus parmotrematis TaxID=2873249 RepID=A0ABS7QRS0_9ACTN|nr:GNAT family N-acetyltransferase [Streptantibioticus parmotrematis]MBY8884504.1 GNAT family N-acetyltransferase [Streptantibioticus parmotrematis]
MRIVTPRLTLRPLTVEDATALVDLHADERVSRYTGAYSHERALVRLAAVEEQWRDRGYGLCAVELKATGEFLGRCGLNYWEQFDEVEAGWALRAAAWGHGYATEAARACVEWAAAALDVPYLTAMIHPGNTASARVAERLGFAPHREDVLFGAPVTVYVRPL